nr:CSS-motif domain-containing protein [Luteimonas padinae]
MDRLRYWLLLTISRRPKAFVRGAGVLVAVVLMAGALVAMVLADHGRTEQRHAEALHMFEGITAESTALLDELSRDEGLDCSAEGLAYLNTRLIGTRYLREIGLLDADRRLVCSTALGRLAVPVKGNYPVHVSRSGLELMDDIPLTVAGKTLRATIIQRPPVNVVVSPYATDDLNARADVLWLRTADGLVALHAGVEPGLLPAMRTRAGRLATTHAAPLGLGYELVTMADGLDLVLQTQRSLPAIVVRGGALFPLLAAASLLVGALAAGAIAPHVARLGELRKRIGFLCDEAHLALVYQPVFELATGRTVGCEVLARLKEGDCHWPPPVTIPAILDAGLERRFDHHTCAGAAGRAAGFRAPGPDAVHRDHRAQPGQRPGQGSAETAGAWLPGRGGRLRHRILQPEVGHAALAGPAEDRRLVRLRARGRHAALRPDPRNRPHRQGRGRGNRGRGDPERAADAAAAGGRRALRPGVRAGGADAGGGVCGGVGISKAVSPGGSIDSES